MSSVDLQIAQANFELELFERAAEQYKHDNNGPMVQTSVGRKVLHSMVRNLTPHIAHIRDESLEQLANKRNKGRSPNWWWMIAFLDPLETAVLTCHAILNARMDKIAGGRKANAICVSIGTAVKHQIELNKWRAMSKDVAKRNKSVDVAELLLKKSKNFNQRQWGLWKSKIDEIENLEWPRSYNFQIGAVLLDAAVKWCGGYFDMSLMRIRGKTERIVSLSPEAEKLITDIEAMESMASPLMRPLLAEPLDWKYNEAENKYDGCYYKIETPLIRSGLYGHTANLDDPVSQENLDNINALQRVPLTIDSVVLDTVYEGYKQGVQFGTLVSADDIPLPQMVTEEEWEAMTPTQRSEIKYIRSKIHTQNARNRGKREQAYRIIAIAQEMRKHQDRMSSPIYQGWSMDSRGRLYTTNAELTTQGADLSKAMFRFHNSKPLGTSGLKALMIHTANCYGNSVDKLPFEQQEKWVADHFEYIKDSALRPLDGHRFWTEAEDEFEFLQACHDVYHACVIENPESYNSNVIIHADASNQGLQLLSLMGADETGMIATNCYPGERQDIYQQTADACIRINHENILKGIPEASNWAGNIHRKTVKRACMTTSYGVTPRGIMDQLVADGHCDDLQGERSANAKYMRDVLLQALEQTVVASRVYMDYFQDCAKAAADYDYPLKWLLPNGTLVQQSYHSLQKTDVTTVVGTFWTWSEDKKGGLQKKKQALAASPNVVHSLDSVLMQETFRRLRVDHGITDFLPVHDSFGVHACNWDLMRQTAREVAYDMFKDDWVRDVFHTNLQLYLPPYVELPEPPQRGTADISKVLEAEYFFA